MQQPEISIHPLIGRLPYEAVREIHWKYEIFDFI